MTNEMITQTTFHFFMDGYETASASNTLLLYYLAIMPHVQDKAYQEVVKVASQCKTPSEPTNEDIGQLYYLEQIMQEVQRVSAIPYTVRTCTKDWPMPSTDIIIPKDMRVMLPILPMHMDPEYFEDPDEFRPERFSLENRGKIKFGTFLPFGLGPRACIGMNIAILEAKMLLYHILRNYIIEPSKKMGSEMAFDEDTFNGMQGEIILKLKSRKIN